MNGDPMKILWWKYSMPFRCQTKRESMEASILLFVKSLNIVRGFVWIGYRAER